MTSAVTRTPAALASRISSTERAALTCATCRCAPVRRASSRSRATMAVSASAGEPGRPQQVACAPSCTTPEPRRFRSSQCAITGRPIPRAYSSTRRITAAFMITAPSSENATAPAPARLAISDMISPRRPWVAAAITRTRTAAGLARAALDVLGHRRRVVHRVGVRHAAHRGVAAGRRRAGAGLDVFLVLLARLAQVRVQVDEAGREPQARRLDHLVGNAAEDSRPTDSIRPSAMSTRAELVAAAGRVEDARALDPQSAHVLSPPVSR